MNKKQIAQLREEYDRDCSRNVSNFKDIVVVNECLDEIERLQEENRQLRETASVQRQILKIQTARVEKEKYDDRYDGFYDDERDK
jgi:hypothetical protein